MLQQSYDVHHCTGSAVTAARTSEVARNLPKAKVALRRMALLRRGSPWLRLAVRAGPLAAAAALSSCGLTDCRAANAANPHGLNDAEWYAAQHAHISLGLPLVEEARQGWWHEVTRRLRTNGEDVNACDPRDGTTLLHLACREGRRRLVEELLSLGAALEARDSKGRTALHWCAENGSESCAATLAASAGRVDVNAQDETGATALSMAARLGHVRLVRWLCSRSDLAPCEPDRYGVTALHKAVSFGQLACVDALLGDKRVRACVDQPVRAPQVPESYRAISGGESPLLLACAHSYKFHHVQHTRIAKALLHAGADPNATDAAGMSCAHCAAASRNISILKELVSSPRMQTAAWSAKDAKGRTPRELAGDDAAILDAMPDAAS